MSASSVDRLVPEADQASLSFVLHEVQTARAFLQLYDTEISEPPRAPGAALSLLNAGLAVDIARRFLPRLDGDARARMDLRLSEIEAGLAEREARYASIQGAEN